MNSEKVLRSIKYQNWKLNVWLTVSLSHFCISLKDKLITTLSRDSSLKPQDS